MFKYSHANTPLGQSERAYYLSYFIKIIIRCFNEGGCPERDSDVLDCKRQAMEMISSENPPQNENGRTEKVC